MHEGKIKEVLLAFMHIKRTITSMNDLRLAAALDGLAIVMSPMTLPAFTDVRSSYWCHYDKIAADGLTSMTVTPMVVGFRIDDTPYLEFNAAFDPETYDTDIYGIVYGDDTFERAFAQRMAQILRAPDHIDPIHYTEAGMQGSDVISLEAGSDWRHHLAALPAHTRLSIARSPEVESFVYRGKDVLGSAAP